MWLFRKSRADLLEDIEDAERSIKSLENRLACSESAVRMWKDARDQYAKLWEQGLADRKNKERELHLLNCAMARKGRRVACLVRHRNLLNLAVADANDQMAQIFVAKDIESARRIAKEVRDDINYFLGGHHDAAMAKQQEVFPALELRKLLTEPSVLEKDEV